MARAIDVADYIITRANDTGQPVSNLSLQKIMYFLNAFSLENNIDEPLIDDSIFEKWTYGPVMPEIYFEYNVFGSDFINEPKQHYVRDEEKGEEVTQEFDIANPGLTQDERKIVDNRLSDLLRIDVLDRKSVV